ncbi:MAG: hypothetical protein JRH18_08995 [Deltaproteobacteria bacterium]|nr:hypothetical protein [Deltaproteobacteria bacterium]MBW1961351.1 hypothetical protein [Deltaproteobacteria bacterium]MBW2151790.1 hypothetical protein [Deltaproteobacteria bacterium]
MRMKEVIVSALQELIVPELDRIKEENGQIKTILELTNKRLDDVNLHLADQSRRIDETNKRIDLVREELGKRIDETNKRIDDVREELSRQDAEINRRLDRLYEVIVRRDEHSRVEERVAALERDVNELKRKIAA